MTLAPPSVADPTRLDARGIDPEARELIHRLARKLTGELPLSGGTVTIGDVVTRMVTLYTIAVAATRDSGDYPADFLLRSAKLPNWLPGDDDGS